MSKRGLIASARAFPASVSDSDSSALGDGGPRVFVRVTRRILLQSPSATHFRHSAVAAVRCITINKRAKVQQRQVQPIVKHNNDKKEAEYAAQAKRKKRNINYKFAQKASENKQKVLLRIVACFVNEYCVNIRVKTTPFRIYSSLVIIGSCRVLKVKVN